MRVIPGWSLASLRSPSEASTFSGTKQIQGERRVHEETSTDTKDFHFRFITARNHLILQIRDQDKTDSTIKRIKLEIYYMLQNNINSWILCVHESKYSCSCFHVEIWLEICIFIYILYILLSVAWEDFLKHRADQVTSSFKFFTSTPLALKRKPIFPIMATLSSAWCSRAGK